MECSLCLRDLKLNNFTKDPEMCLCDDCFIDIAIAEEPEEPEE